MMSVAPPGPFTRVFLCAPAAQWGDHSGGQRIRSTRGTRTFLGGTMAVASLGGMEMWCGLESFSPFMDLRN